MTIEPHNEARLREAGIINHAGDLPPEYKDVIDGLSDDEVAKMVSIKQRLDDAEAATESDVTVGDVGIAP
jgi:hypothetical protein